MANNLHKAKIKELRADARKLVVIAKHLREEAKSKHCFDTRYS